MPKIKELIKHFPETGVGIFETKIRGVRYFKETRPVPRQPLVYDPGICIIVQGKKTGYLGGQTFQYDESNYLVTTVTMPFECEAQASFDNPLKGLFIDIDMTHLHDLIGKLGLEANIEILRDKGLPKGIGPAVMDDEMADSVLRLIKCFTSEADARILGEGLVREILYRALSGSQAPVLYSLVTHNSSFSQVAHVLKIMQNEYSANFDIEKLAGKARMSSSAFHRAFKEITSDSPIQYLKKIRLSKARDFILYDNMKAYIAADKVGYESSSQFSREFKRYFGQSPTEMMKQLKAG